MPFKRTREAAGRVRDLREWFGHPKTIESLYRLLVRDYLLAIAVSRYGKDARWLPEFRQEGAAHRKKA